nr:S8 family serine peptidase [bacterium]
MKKRLISCAVILTFLTAFLQPFSLPAVSGSALASSNGADQLVGKKTSYLAAKVALASDNERIPVCVEFEGVDESEMYAAFEERYPEDYANYLLRQNSQGKDLTMAEVQAALAHKRQIYQQLYQEKNMANLQEFMEALPTRLSVGQSAPNVNYISMFSPVCFLDINKAQLDVLESTRGVQRLEYDAGIQAEDELSALTQESRSKYIRDNYGNKGAGVGIGQIESGLPYPPLTPELTNVNITLDPDCPPAVSQHATRVAAILVGKNNGCAPSAKLYSTSIAGMDALSTFYQRVEWLLSRTNPVVSIINMSEEIYGSIITPGTYDVVAQWVDHIAMQHDVHFVKSAGNNADESGDKTGRITCPGMAYNIVTVGCYKVDDKAVNPYTAYTTTLSSFSSYVESAGIARKPDLVAPGHWVLVENLYENQDATSGTSFASPMVAGIMAQLISCTPALAAQQRAMKAILLASAWDKLDNTPFVPMSGTSQMDDKQGVGKVDAKNARYSLANGLYTQALLASTSFPYTKTVTFSSSASSARVALVWSKRNKITGSHTGSPSVSNPTLSDLDLHVYAPDGTLVAYSQQGSGNVEIVQFNPTVSGTYTIKVYRASGTESQDSIALAWW